MPHSNIISANSEQEAWQKIEEQLKEKKDQKDYTAQFTSGSYNVTLDIDIHPESGNESGTAITSFTTLIPDETSFRFMIDKQHFKNEIKKLFGMQDVIVGNQELDKKFIIQGNDEAKVKELLSHAEVCSALLSQPVEAFETRELKIGMHRETVLAFEIEGMITDISILTGLFNAFKIVLDSLK